MVDKIKWKYYGNKGGDMENNSSVMEFYENYNENERINRDVLEYIRTKDIILRNLPKDPIKIIDLCGASGHYAYWLAEMGHEVHLMDLSPKHIIEAKKNEQKYSSRLASMTTGDARSLNFGDGSFDMVLLMGALYHLQEKEDRLLCLKEVYRILKNGGTAVFSYISRYSAMLDGFISGFIFNSLDNSKMDLKILTGKHNNPENKPGNFTTAYLHTTNDIFEELLYEKFCDIVLYAVEGFGGLINKEKYLDNNDKLEKLLYYLRLTEQNSEMIGISFHQLAICKKNIM
jgi:ubiquinone/menaquinone biosynthesis C-methylase UbiE